MMTLTKNEKAMARRITETDSDFLSQPDFENQENYLRIKYGHETANIVIEFMSLQEDPMGTLEA